MTKLKNFLSGEPHPFLSKSLLSEITYQANGALHFDQGTFFCTLASLIIFLKLFK